jgi:hypothetical protein
MESIAAARSLAGETDPSKIRPGMIVVTEGH